MTPALEDTLAVLVYAARPMHKDDVAKMLSIGPEAARFRLHRLSKLGLALAMGHKWATVSVMAAEAAKRADLDDAKKTAKKVSKAAQRSARAKELALEKAQRPKADYLPRAKSVAYGVCSELAPDDGEYFYAADISLKYDIEPTNVSDSLALAIKAGYISSKVDGGKARYFAGPSIGIFRKIA